MLPLLLALALLAPRAQAAEPLVLAEAKARQALADSPKPGAPDDDAGGDYRGREDEPLPNFGTLAEGLTRSAQPSAEGFERLKKMGVKTVLTLRTSSKEERRLAEKLGLKVVHVPMNGVLSPTFEQVDRALALLKDPARRPLHFHCRYGKDRTGVVAAAYRVAVEGKDVEGAVREAKSYGCCAPLFKDLKNYLEEYRRRPRP